ncbi:hypothetical protein AB1Y20_018022 [Prymnesium parvum]|uniref:Transmembrane protein n=1 Tax=Prymnesium parvum TaxID=97485 RepID=A0AB34JP59_PRYPA
MAVGDARFVEAVLQNVVAIAVATCLCAIVVGLVALFHDHLSSLLAAFLLSQMLCKRVAALARILKPAEAPSPRPLADAPAPTPPADPLAPRQALTLSSLACLVRRGLSIRTPWLSMLCILLLLHTAGAAPVAAGALVLAGGACVLHPTLRALSRLGVYPSDESVAQLSAMLVLAAFALVILLLVGVFAYMAGRECWKVLVDLHALASTSHRGWGHLDDALLQGKELAQAAIAWLDGSEQACRSLPLRVRASAACGVCWSSAGCTHPFVTLPSPRTNLATVSSSPSATSYRLEPVVSSERRTGNWCQRLDVNACIPFVVHQVWAPLAAHLLSVFNASVEVQLLPAEGTSLACEAEVALNGNASASTNETLPLRVVNISLPVFSEVLNSTLEEVNAIFPELEVYMEYLEEYSAWLRHVVESFNSSESLLGAIKQMVYESGDSLLSLAKTLTSLDWSTFIGWVSHTLASNARWLLRAFSFASRLCGWVLDLGVQVVSLVAFTWWFLSWKVDALTHISRTLVPNVSTATWSGSGRRSTSERNEPLSHLHLHLPTTYHPRVHHVRSVFTIPMTAAARHATILLSADLLVGIPYSFIAATLIVVFTIFPFLDAVYILVPCWVLPLFLFGRLSSAIAAVLVVIAPFFLRDPADQIAISSWAYDFSLAVGVYSMGWKGVLFAPLLVCSATLLYDIGGQVIQEYATGHQAASASGMANDLGDEDDRLVAPRASSQNLRRAATSPSRRRTPSTPRQRKAAR